MTGVVWTRNDINPAVIARSGATRQSFEVVRWFRRLLHFVRNDGFLVNLMAVRRSVGMRVTLFGVVRVVVSGGVVSVGIPTQSVGIMI